MDYTGTLKYEYKIKNCDENLEPKKKQIIQKREQSIRTIRMMAQQEFEIESYSDNEL
jgi:hypothetical protein